MANGNDQDRDQYTVRRENRRRGVRLRPDELETALEMIAMSPELMQQSFRSARQTAGQMFSGAPDFSEADQRQLELLQSQAQQLQPAQIPGPMRGLLPGNPYAVSLENLSRGVNNLVGSLVNEDRARELYGDPEKAQRLYDSANQKITKAQKLRRTADTLESQGRFQVAGGQSSIDEMRSDAQALEQAAEQEMQASQQARGVLGQAQTLRREQQLAQEATEQRRELTSQLGRDTYQQALQGERESRRDRRTAERQQMRQQFLTDRLRIREREGTRQARIRAFADLREAQMDQEAEDRATGDELIPDYAKPMSIQRFISNYEESLEENESDIRDEAFEQDTFVGAEDMTEEQVRTELERIQGIRQLLRDIDSDAEFWDNADIGDELPPQHYPTDAEMRTLEQMEKWAVPAEVIDAWKFYNRISLTKAPAAPSEQQPEGGAPGDFSDFYNQGGGQQ